jgi:hypothetical protein
MPFHNATTIAPFLRLVDPTIKGSSSLIFWPGTRRIAAHRRPDRYAWPRLDPTAKIVRFHFHLQVSTQAVLDGRCSAE